MRIKIPSGLNSNNLKISGRYFSIVNFPTLTGLTSGKRLLLGGSAFAQSRRALPGRESLIAPGLHEAKKNRECAEKT